MSKQERIADVDDKYIRLTERVIDEKSAYIFAINYSNENFATNYSNEKRKAKLVICKKYDVSVVFGQSLDSEYIILDKTMSFF